MRDELLGLVPKDADIEVYGLEAPVLRGVLEKLGRVGAVGESFRVYKLSWFRDGERYELDVSLPRRDKKIGTGHKGFEVEGDPYATVEEAARRRDFTVNAILQDPLTQELIDPYGGVRDLEDRVLRAVDAAHFGEDSLRVLRAVQFAARFGMTVEARTVDICRHTPIDDLPKERIWGEWEKWLLKSPKPSVGWRVACELEILPRLFPYLAAADERWGAEIEASLDRAAFLRADWPAEKQVALMLAVLGSYLGRRNTERLLDALNIFKIRGEKGAADVRKLVLQLVSVRKLVPDWFRRRDAVQDYEFRYLSARMEPRLVLALARARGYLEAADWFQERLRAAGVLDGPPVPILQGRHLLEMGLQPGPLVGEIVNAVYLQQLRNEVTNLEEAREAAQRYLARKSEDGK